jgi:hypothetical protein
VAIPLEFFISSARTVLGVIVAGILRFIAFVLRLMGNVAVYSGKVIITIYDLVIFPTLWVEGVLTGSPHKVKKSSKPGTEFGFSKKSKKRSNTGIKG